MLTLAIKFNTTPDRVFAQIPMLRNGTVNGGLTRFACYPRTSSEQCPGCGGDIAEHWRIESDDLMSGRTEPELGESFTATCKNHDTESYCNFSMTGTVVEMER